MGNAGKTLMHVAWMSVLLGLILEGTILVVSTTFGKQLEARPVLADLMQKVSWSFIVCIGLALGRGASRMMNLQNPAFLGVIGLLSAPVAFAVARSVHEGIQEALFIKVYQGGGGAPLLLALIKGVEYGCLGALFSWLSNRKDAKAAAFAGAGLLVGVVFGFILLLLLISDHANPPTAGTLISRGINEIINPVGCSLTLYAAEVLGRGSAQPAGT